MTQVFNVNDIDTAAWVSKALGDSTMVYETGSTGTSHKSLDWAGEGTTTNRGTSTHLTRRALLTPDEVRCLPQDRAILFLAGEAPVLARKVIFHRDAEFAELFDEGHPPQATRSELSTVGPAARSMPVMSTMSENTTLPDSTRHG